MKQRERGEDEGRTSLRHLAAKKLYALGYRITPDGRLSRPHHGIERIISYGGRDGPGTRIIVTGEDGVTKEVHMPYALLAALSFYGDSVLRPGLRIVFKDGDKANLRKTNVFVDIQKMNRREQALKWKPLSKRQETWARKQREAAAADLRATRPELFDRERCRVLAFAVDNKQITLEEAAKKLETNITIALSMLLVGRHANAKAKEAQT